MLSREMQRRVYVGMLIQYGIEVVNGLVNTILAKNSSAGSNILEEAFGKADGKSSLCLF
jgi:hypothetical protein